MYSSENFSSGLVSPALNGNTPWDSSRSRVPPPDDQARDMYLARSPREAMQMAESSESNEFFPTVTITLTTLLWPGTAH